MKIPLLISAFAFYAVITSTAQTIGSSAKVRSSTAAPTNHADANDIKIAKCQVSCGALGDVKSEVMDGSTGSKALDEQVMKSVREDLRGLSNTTLTIPVPYKQVEAATPRGKIAVSVAFPRPPYPYQARAIKAQGSGIVQASFDESGNVLSAVMARSTGSKILDGNTVNYALKRWKSSGKEKITTMIPVAYRIR